MHDALSRKAADFVLLDVRSPALYKKAHLPGALSLPHGKITERRMSEWPAGTLFVVYCAGPHCNGADKGALRLANLGRPVKLMIGGMTAGPMRASPLLPAASPALSRTELAFGSFRAGIAAMHPLIGMAFHFRHANGRRQSR